MRPRFSTKRGYARAYKTWEDEEWEELIRSEYVSQCGEMHEGEVSVAVMVSRHLPPSVRGRWPDGQPDTMKPDIDNIVKSVLDALNGVAWEDDSSVTHVEADKAWRVPSDEDVLIVTVTDEIDQRARDGTWGRRGRASGRFTR